MNAPLVVQIEIEAAGESYPLIISRILPLADRIHQHEISHAPLPVGFLSWIFRTYILLYLGSHTRTNWIIGFSRGGKTDRWSKLA